MHAHSHGKVLTVLPQCVQECLLAWRQLTRSQALLRLKAHRMLTAVLRQVELQRLRQAVRFWRLYTACCICERLQLQLPTFTHSCDVFDAWLWRHERRLYTQQQAVGLSGRLALLRCFGEARMHPLLQRHQPLLYASPVCLSP